MADKYRLTLSSVVECNADQIQAIAGIVANALVTMGAQSPKVTVAKEPGPGICENPAEPVPRICTDCPNFDVALDGGAYCRLSLKAIY